MDLFRLKAHELQQKLSRREVSAVEITQSVLARADQVDSTIQSFITRTPEAALAQAKRVDEKLARGESVSPLAGIPGALKDNMCTKGIKTTCASKILANFVPPYDATITEKLAAADAVIVGKANMTNLPWGPQPRIPAFLSPVTPGIPSGYPAVPAVARARRWRPAKRSGRSVLIQAARFGCRRLIAAW